MTMSVTVQWLSALSKLSYFSKYAASHFTNRDGRDHKALCTIAKSGEPRMAYATAGRRTSGWLSGPCFVVLSHVASQLHHVTSFSAQASVHTLVWSLCIVCLMQSVSGTLCYRIIPMSPYILTYLRLIVRSYHNFRQLPHHLHIHIHILSYLAFNCVTIHHIAVSSYIRGCMDACLSACMYACTHARGLICLQTIMPVCLHARILACTPARLHVSFPALLA